MEKATSSALPAGARAFARAGRLARPAGRLRRLVGWGASYLLVLQLILGALSAAAMVAAERAGAPILCVASTDASHAPQTDHDGAHASGCMLCPLSGSVPLLADAPAVCQATAGIYRPAAPRALATLSHAPPVFEHARSRAPPLPA